MAPISPEQQAVADAYNAEFAAAVGEGARRRAELAGECARLNHQVAVLREEIARLLKDRDAAQPADRPGES